MMIGTCFACTTCTLPAANGQAVLHGVSLAVARGEFVSLLGPSGAGQTALLALVAGLAAPHSGDILLDGASLLPVPSHRRGIGAFFGDPPLLERGLAENLASPLLARRLPGEAIARAVERALDAAGLAGQGGRRMEGMTRLERRRAAIARALVTGPALLLLDRPCAGLDGPEREALLGTLRDLTAVHGLAVLHGAGDPVEALALADRIALLRDGVLHALGSPEALYERPASAFAATATGEVNLVPGFAEAIEDGIAMVRLAGGALVEAESVDAVAGRPCRIAVRPERIAVARADAADLGGHALEAVVARRLYRGDHTRLHLAIGGTRLIATRPAGAPVPPRGSPVALAWAAQHARAFHCDI